MTHHRLLTRLSRLGVVAAVLAASLAIGTAVNAPVMARADASSAQGGLFHALTQRVLDTRNGTGGFAVAKFTANSWHSIAVEGQGAIPAANVSAVQVTFTVANQAAAGVLHADKTGVTTPNTSVPYVTFDTSTTSNTAVLPIGSDGKFQVQMTQTSDLLIDVQGYYTGGNAAGGGFVPTPAEQIYNSGSTKYAGGQSVSFSVAGVDPVPTNASAVMLDIIEANGGSNAGYLEAYPTGGAKPTASLNWPAGRNFEWTTTVPLNSSGQITIAVGGASGAVNLSVGVEGYFTAEDGSTNAGEFTAASARVFSTTSAANPIASSGIATIPVAGVAGLPALGSGISVVSANVEVISGSGAQGNMTVYPDGDDPNQSTQQFYAGKTTTAFVTVPLGADGAIAVENDSGGPITVVVDVEGWYFGAGAATISCPSPYTNGSWSKQIPAQPISCTVTAPSANDSDGLLQTTLDGNSWDSDSLAASGVTTETVDIPAFPGTHTITATTSAAEQGAGTVTTFSLGFGDWASATLTPSPQNGSTASTTPTLAVTPDSDAFSSDARTQYTVSTHADGVTSPVVQSGWIATGFDVPAGTLAPNTAYFWTAVTTGTSGGSTTPVAVTSPVYSFNTNVDTTDSTATINFQQQSGDTLDDVVASALATQSASTVASDLNQLADGAANGAAINFPTLEGDSPSDVATQLRAEASSVSSGQTAAAHVDNPAARTVGPNETPDSSSTSTKSWNNHILTSSQNGYAVYADRSWYMDQMLRNLKCKVGNLFCHVDDQYQMHMTYDPNLRYARIQVNTYHTVQEDNVLRGTTMSAITYRGKTQVGSVGTTNLPVGHTEIEYNYNSSLRNSSVTLWWHFGNRSAAINPAVSNHSATAQCKSEECTW